MHMHEPKATDERSGERNFVGETMSSDDQRISVRITGRVQGVGFRHFTTTHAHRLGLGGWVRNTRDGAVELEAEGPREKLEALLEALGQGPDMAHVERVAPKWKDADGSFDRFYVRH